MDAVSKQILAVVEGYLRALGEARFAMQLALQEIRQVYDEPRAREEAVARGDASLELSTAIPEAHLTQLPDGTVAVQYAGDRQRYVVADEAGTWRIHAVERTFPDCGDPDCDSCPVSWARVLPEVAPVWGGADGSEETHYAEW